MKHHFATVCVRGIFLITLICASSVVWAQVVITDIVAEPRPGTNLVDVTYNLESEGDRPVWISLFFSSDGGLTFSDRCLTVSGAVGPGVLPGTGLEVVWAQGTDYPQAQGSECQIRVTAYQIVTPGDFATVPAGTFTMGSPLTELGRNANEIPHEVSLTRSFLIQTTEVTNQQYMEAAQWAYDHGWLTVYSTEIRDNIDDSDLVLRNINGSNDDDNDGSDDDSNGSDDDDNDGSDDDSDWQQ